MQQVQSTHEQEPDTAPRAPGQTNAVEQEVRLGTLVVVAPDGTPVPYQIWCARLDDLVYLAATPDSTVARYLEEDGRVCLLLGNPNEQGSTLTGIAVPVPDEEEQEMVLERLADNAPEAGLLFRVATEPLVPPEVMENTAENRLLVQSTFSNLPPSVAQAMAHQLHYETFDAGEVVIEQGTVADRFFIVVTGEVEVLEQHDGAEQPVIVLGPGESFGETALLLHTRRTATVRARTPLLVLALDRHAFEQALMLSTELDADE